MFHDVWQLERFQTAKWPTSDQRHGIVVMELLVSTKSLDVEPG